MTRNYSEALAAYLADADPGAIPADVRNEARRALLNYVGCALGGAPEPAVEVAVRTLAPYSGAPAANVLGRPERFDALNAALLNGIASHVHEYDDTTPKNYIHPTVPVASALFAYASANRVTGVDFVTAFVLGFEAESRIGDAVYPAHYEAGWHITSTAGVFGAAAAVGWLLRLSKRQMVWALGLAATQAAGIREMFGSMAKSFQPGRAAQNGYTSALLAGNSFTAGERPIEAPRGFASVTTAEYDLDEIVNGLGTEFSLRDNAYKPYACGLVVHPAIDGCSEIRRRHRIDPDAVEAVRLRVAPLVLDLCNKRELKDALETKYSIYHAAAIGLARGKGGLDEFTEAALNDPVLARLRERTTAEPDAAITEDQVRIEVELGDGTRLEHFVERSLGNLNKPLTDDQLVEKFRDQAVRALPAASVERVIGHCLELESLDDVGQLVRASVPSARAAEPEGLVL